MKKFWLSFVLISSFFSPLVVEAQSTKDLESYIKNLREDLAGPLNETGFLSAGSDFLYGQDYFDAQNYSSAEWYFLQAVKKQNDNAFANYQLGISMIRQNDPGKKQQAQEYLKAAFDLNPYLEERYNKDVTAQTKSSDPIANTEADLDAYIAGMKNSAATGGSETSLGTPGYEALYGIEYYEAQEYGSAETSFSLSLRRDSENPYTNYLMAVSLAAQSKSEASKTYLQKASAGDPKLLQRFDEDVAKAKASWQKKVDSKKIITTPATKPTKGGPLIAGNYTCHQSVWNGPNKSPAYSFQYKGYFELKSNGTYRWLDDGESGKYSYDAKTGVITWLSGFLKNSGLKTSLYKVNTEMGQMTLSFSDSNSWECGCKNQ